MAIMVTPKLANLPDVTTTTPSDGQVLTYDDGTGKWVNEAVPAGVTDHGALTGLADDDHSQYVLANGTRAMTGALAVTMSAAGDRVVIDGSNSGDPGAVRQTIKLGRSFGSRTVEIGVYSAVSNFADAHFVAYSNSLSQFLLSAYNGKLGIGNVPTPTATIEAKYSTGVDYLVASFLNTTGPATTTDNVIRIGRETGDRYVDIGVRGIVNFASPAFLIKRTDAHTNSVYNMQIIDCRTTGTPTTGFGAGLLFQLETSTTESQDAARISAVWSDATHATRTGDIVFSTVSGAAALSEKLRLTGAGILKFSGTMGNSTKVPGTDAPADWVQIDIGGTTYYLPAYAA